MLVLTRKAGESITIGKDIEIKIVKIGKNQVKLSFIVPPDMIILRDNAKVTTKDGGSDNDSFG